VLEVEPQSVRHRRLDRYRQPLAALSMHLQTRLHAGG
jgi:hypothetical protein